MEMNPRLRAGLVLIATAVLIFIWSQWLTAMFYDIDLPHPPEGWSVSRYGLIAAVIMIIGSVLFIIGTYLVLTPEDRPQDVDTKQFS